jgi:hypothetical protein
VPEIMKKSAKCPFCYLKVLERNHPTGAWTVRKPWGHTMFHNLSCWSIQFHGTGRLILSSSRVSVHMEPEVLITYLHQPYHIYISQSLVIHSHTKPVHMPKPYHTKIHFNTIFQYNLWF